MSDTIKDYLVGFKFDVDDGGAGKIESILKDLDNVVRNLAKVLTQATDSVQGFMNNLQQQAQSANKSSGEVQQLAANTQQFSSEAEGGSRAASILSSILNRMGQSASDAKDDLKKTGAEMDNTREAANKATSAVDGLSKAMSGMMGFIKLIAGAAVVKKFLSVAKSLYEYDQTLEQTAKSLKKTTEEARAHTKALEAMGKTYEEIKKDKKLKATYDELVALGESMALPEAEDGTDNIRDMVSSFEKLKMVGSYAMQWLYHSVQDMASGPLMRFKGTLDEITENLKLNLPRLSVAGGHIIDGVLRIVSAFAKGATKIIELLDKIPGPIKVIIGLITAAALLIKAGPFGWMAAILTGIGILLDDFFGYMEGENATLGPFWEECIKVYAEIEAAVTKAIETIKTFWETSKNEDGSTDWIGFGSKVAGWILDGIRDGLNGIGTKIKTWITGDENASWDQVGTAIVEKVKAGIENVQGVGKQIIEAIFQLVNEQGITDDITALLTNASDFAGGILKAIVDSIPDLAEGAAENFTAIIEGIAGIINGKFLTEDIPSLIKNADKWATAILQSISDAIPLIGDSANDILKAIVTAICDLINGVTSEDFTNSLGDFAVNLITGLANVLGSAVEKTGELSKTIADAIPGVINNLFKALTNIFSKENIGKVGDSIKGFVSSLFKAIGDTIGGALDAVGGLEGIDIGTGAADILTNLIGKIFSVTSDLSEDPNVTGFVEKLGQGLSTALETLGEIVGSFAGRIVSWLFSGEAISDIFNAGVNIIKLLIEGLQYGIAGIANFTFGLLDGILESLGLIDPDQKAAYEAALQTGELYKEAITQAFDEAMDEISDLEFDGGDQSKIQENLNNAIVDSLFGDIDSFSNDTKIAFLDKIKAGLGDLTEHDFANSEEYDVISGVFQDAVSGLWTKLSEDALTANGLGDEFTGENVKSVMGPFIEALGGSAATLTDEMYEAIATNLREGGLENKENLMGLLFGNILESANGGAENGDEYADTVGKAAKKLGIESAEAAKEAYQEGYESVDKEVGSVSEGFEAASQEGLDGVTRTLNDGKGEVKEAAEAVSDEAVQAFLMTMNQENGASIAQTFIDGMVEKLGELSSQVEDVVRLVNAKFASIPGKAKSAFSSLVSNIKSTLDPLPQYVSEIVTKINDELGKIKKNININTTTSGNIDGNSEGGVIDKETITRVGEGNKREYIIPVTKPNRAIPLLERAANDLGLSVQSYANATKMLGGSAGANVTPAYAAAAATSGGVVNNYNNTIDAHANINVSGSDPVSTANNVNRSHEQIVLRNVKPLIV